jgi:integrase/recombinase XerD
MSTTVIDPGTSTTRSRQAYLTNDPRELREFPASVLVQRFLDYYWVRHPISRETIEAYRTDLLAFDTWLKAFRDKTLVGATQQNVRDFLDSRYRSGSPQLRDMPSLSCIKRFYFHLMDLGIRTDDPTERVYVRTPRLVRQDLSVIQGDKKP